MHQSKLREFLIKKFDERKERNQEYSIRAFARDLDLSSSELAQILNGSRQISFNKGKYILDQLSVSAPIRNSLLLSLDDPENYIEIDELHTQSAKELRVTKHWQAYAILSLIEIKDPPQKAAEFAERLGCDLDIIEGLLSDLIDLGFVVKEGEKLAVKEIRLTTTNNIPNEDLIDAHVQGIEKSLKVLKNREGRRRSDFSGYTLAIDRSKLPEAKRRLREMCRYLAKFLNEGETDDVYRLQVQLFPYTVYSKENR